MIKKYDLDLNSFELRFVVLAAFVWVRSCHWSSSEWQAALANHSDFKKKQIAQVFQRKMKET